MNQRIFLVKASDVRAWARRRGLPVGTRGHMPQDVIDAFNRAHKVRYFVNTNPSAVRAAA